MRQILGDGIQWHVHEANAAHVPGARRDRCLIFDSDGIVRRVWTYPADWMNLTDDALWALVDGTGVPPGDQAPARGPERRHSPRALPSVIAVAAELARSRAIAAELAVTADESHHEALARASERCDELRRSLHIAVNTYAETLRGNGVPPERAVVLIKAAVRDGLESSGACDELDENEIIDEGVAWGIESYYGI
jgi:hypothetical protein